MNRAASPHQIPGRGARISDRQLQRRGEWASEVSAAARGVLLEEPARTKTEWKVRLQLCIILLLIDHPCYYFKELSAASSLFQAGEQVSDATASIHPSILSRRRQPCQPPGCHFETQPRSAHPASAHVFTSSPLCPASSPGHPPGLAHFSSPTSGPHLHTHTHTGASTQPHHSPWPVSPTHQSRSSVGLFTFAARCPSPLVPSGQPLSPEPGEKTQAVQHPQACSPIEAPRGAAPSGVGQTESLQRPPSPRMLGLKNTPKTAHIKAPHCLQSRGSRARKLLSKSRAPVRAGAEDLGAADPEPGWVPAPPRASGSSE